MHVGEAVQQQKVRVSLQHTVLFTVSCWQELPLPACNCRQHSSARPLLSGQPSPDRGRKHTALLALWRGSPILTLCLPQLDSAPSSASAPASGDPPARADPRAPQVCGQRPLSCSLVQTGLSEQLSTIQCRICLKQPQTLLRVLTHLFLLFKFK